MAKPPAMSVKKAAESWKGRKNDAVRSAEESEHEEFEYWRNKYIEMFGEENLFATKSMSHDEILEIFKKAVKKKKPYKDL